MASAGRSENKDRLQQQTPTDTPRPRDSTYTGCARSVHTQVGTKCKDSCHKKQHHKHRTLQTIEATSSAKIIARWEGEFHNAEKPGHPGSGHSSRASGQIARGVQTVLNQSGKPAKVPETKKGVRANRTTEPTHRALEPRRQTNSTNTQYSRPTQSLP